MHDIHPHLWVFKVYIKKIRNELSKRILTEWRKTRGKIAAIANHDSSKFAKEPMITQKKSSKYF